MNLLTRIRHRLIDDWRCGWRFWSVRLGALGTLLEAAFLALPDLALEIWAMVPAELVPFGAVRVVPLILIALGLAARFVKQRKLDAAARS